jgi:hypothetical protein
MIEHLEQDMFQVADSPASSSSPYVRYEIVHFDSWMFHVAAYWYQPFLEPVKRSAARLLVFEGLK